MKNVNAITEKTYILETIDQDGYNETYEICAFNLKEAKQIKSQIIGNSRSGEVAVGQLRLKK